MLDLRQRGGGFEPAGCPCAVSLNKIHLSLLSTGSTHEDPSQRNSKLVDCDVKNQIIVLGRCNVIFNDILDFGTYALCLTCSKSASKYRGTCSIMEAGAVWRSWRRCSSIIFIEISLSIYDTVKRYCEKLVLKLTSWSFFRHADEI